jgi:3-phosphoglycerate kinase
MKKKSIKDIDVKGKRVFVRVDINVPLHETGDIRDDTRIKASVPTLRYLLDSGAKVICAAHLGRPGGEKIPALTLKPVGERLSQLLNAKVNFPGEITGKKVDILKSGLKEGDILLLQNLRFHPGETANDKRFAKELAKDIDIHVNDAFGVSHRAHASTQAITEFVPISAAGFLLKKEIDFLAGITENPPKNYTIIMGGDRVPDKILFIPKLMEKAQKILIGGAIAYHFMAAKGINVGRSDLDEDAVKTCKDILKKTAKKKAKLILPVDHIAAMAIEPEVTIRMIKKGSEIPEEMMGLDIGFETIQLFTRELKGAELIVWNGPLGVFEIDTFSAGTTEIAREVAALPATTFVGGGDSVAAVEKAGVAEQFTHLSTGGAASLMFLAGENLPGIDALSEEE